MASGRGSAARLAASAGCAAVAVLLSGCGIRPTPVLRADPGPQVVPVADASPAPPDLEQRPPAEPGFPAGAPFEDRPGVPVYFVDNGALRAVDRFDVAGILQLEPNEDSSALVRLAVQELLSGPRSDGAEGRLTTALPAGSDPAAVRIRLLLPQLLVELDVTGDRLTPLARTQVSCTVHRAVRRIAPVPGVDIRLKGSNGEYAPLPACPSPALTAQPVPS